MFVLGGMAVGCLLHNLAGCITGTCAITSNPWISVVYIGFIGWLLSGGCSGGKCCGDVCNM